MLTSTASNDGTPQMLTPRIHRDFTMTQEIYVCNCTPLIISKSKWLTSVFMYSHFSEVSTSSIAHFICLSEKTYLMPALTMNTLNIKTPQSPVPIRVSTHNHLDQLMSLPSPFTLNVLPTQPTKNKEKRDQNILHPPYPSISKSKMQTTI